MMLRAEQLTVGIGTRTLCRDLNLTVSPGELWGVLGCNGSGKTTLLHALAGLAPTAGGSIELAGRRLADYSRRERGRMLGILLQMEDYEFWGSVEDYVMLGRYPHARKVFGWHADDEAAAAHAMEAFDLTALKDQAYVTLSGGERQRARLAQLWAQAPRVMLLDEPLQHLDLRHQLQTIQLLCASTREQATAAALVLHDLTFAASCDRILMLYGDGRHAAGSAADMLQLERLEVLYGCRLRAFGDGAGVRFMPVI